MSESFCERELRQSSDKEAIPLCFLREREREREEKEKNQEKCVYFKEEKCLELL